MSTNESIMDSTGFTTTTPSPDDGIAQSIGYPANLTQDGCPEGLFRVPQGCLERYPGLINPCMPLPFILTNCYGYGQGNVTRSQSYGYGQGVIIQSQPLVWGNPVEDKIQKVLGMVRQLGLPVFPCQPRGKEPWMVSSWKEAATTDENTISQWFASHPDSNIAVCLQRDVAVLDCDFHKVSEETIRTDYPGLLEYLEEVAFAIQKTPRGGKHYFVHLPPGFPNNTPQTLDGLLGVKSKATVGERPALAIDVRLPGKGYVLIEPSETKHGKYRFKRLPEVGSDRPILDLDKLRQLFRVSMDNNHHGGEQCDGQIPEGKRNNTLTSLAGFLRHYDLTKDCIEDILSVINETYCKPPLRHQEVKTIAASMSGYPADPNASRLDSKKLIDRLGKGLYEKGVRDKDCLMKCLQIVGRQYCQSPVKDEIISVIDEPAYQRFPIEVFPETVQQYIEYSAAALNVDPSYVGLPLLCAAGVAIGTTRKIRVRFKEGGEWDEFPIVWVMLVGKSGERKSTAIDQALKFVRQKNTEYVEQDEENQKKYDEQLKEYEIELRNYRRRSKSNSADAQSAAPPCKPQKPAKRQCFARNVTVEGLTKLLAENPRGGLVLYEELSSWIGSFDKYHRTRQRRTSDQDFWVDAFEGRDFPTVRKTADSSLFCPRASVWVCGGIQPSILKRYFDKETQDMGLLARFLITNPARPAPKEKQPADDDHPSNKPPFVECMRKIFDKLFNLGFSGQQPFRMAGERKPKYEPIIVRLSSEANKVWIGVHNQFEGELYEMPESGITAAWSRLHKYTLRIALILHYLKWAEREVTNSSQPINEFEIDAETMKNTITLIEWCKNEIRRIYPRLQESEGEEQLRELREWIKKQQRPVTVREVQRAFPSTYRTAELARETLRTLERQGYGKLTKKTPSDSHGGRPTEVFELYNLPQQADEHLD